MRSDLDDLERALAAATPGPWTLCRGTKYAWAFGPVEHNGGASVFERASFADAEAIVAIRAHIPSLLSRLRALEAVAEAADAFDMETRADADDPPGRLWGPWSDETEAAAQRLMAALSSYRSIVDKKGDEL